MTGLAKTYLKEKENVIQRRRLRSPGGGIDKLHLRCHPF